MSVWEDQIERELQWRESELAILKSQVAQSPQGSPRYVTLLRASCAMLYAHYEGFCKFLWDLYLDSVEQAGIKREDCTTELTTFSLAADFKRIRSDASDDEMRRFCETSFHSLMQASLRFEVHPSTESNLWPHILKKNCNEIGLSCSMANIHELRLKSLVARRNGIAHGQKLEVSDLSVYQELEAAVIDVMYELALDIVERLDKEAYRKSLPSRDAGDRNV